MMIKVNNEYLDFNGSIEIEKKIKLFETIDATEGDFSYSFTLPWTDKNKRIINQYSLTQGNKVIYKHVPTILLNDQGIQLYDGFLKVEKVRLRDADCSFFSGNSNWFSRINGQLLDMDLSEYDIILDEASIESSLGNTEGVFFPVINTGALNTRSYISLKVRDFHPFIYVKTIISKIFHEAGLKLEGEILSDWRYNRLITSNNDASVPQEERNKRMAYVGKDTTQLVTTTEVPLTFPLTTTPYEVGEVDNWDETNNRYVADLPMTVNISFTYIAANVSLNYLVVRVRKNGTQIGYQVVLDGQRSGTIENIDLNTGDYIDMSVQTLGGTADITDATFRVTVTDIQKVFTVAFVPKSSKSEFVSEILSMLNTVVTYDNYTDTVTVDFFKSISTRPPVDISEYINPDTIEEDYEEFISNYGRQNDFRYSESSEQNIEEYNKNNSIKYGDAREDSFNENTEPEADVVELDVVAVAETTNNPFGAYLPELKYVELEEQDEFEILQIIDVSGVPEFTAIGLAPSEGDLVRLYDSPIGSYNGDYVISYASGDNFRVWGLAYDGDADLKVRKLRYEQVDSSDQIFLLAVPNVPVSFFAPLTGIYLEQGFNSNFDTAYFYKPLQGLGIDQLNQSLSFGPINIPGAHQRTLVRDYWQDFVEILRDPAKVTAEAKLPEVLFNSLDFKTPVLLKTDKFTATFYLNRISGYQASYLPCMKELIKLS